MKKSSPIGIFDSGIGGLTVAKEIINLLPNENLVYVGDTARVPYGARSKEVITEFALELAKFLLERDVKFLVVACNTISATCLEAIETLSPVPVLGVIEPTVRLAIETTKNNKLGIIGTRATIGSGIYKEKIDNLKEGVGILAQPCPLFVPLAEEGLGKHQVAYIVAKEYLEKITKENVDTLVLGCTHYPLLAEVIQKIVGREVTLIDSAKPTAGELKAQLIKNDLINDFRKSSYDFFVTDDPERAKTASELLFGGSLPGKITQIKL